MMSVNTDVWTRAKTNILNVNEQINFLKNEYSNILYIISISLIALNHKGHRKVFIIGQTKLKEMLNN